MAAKDSSASNPYASPRGSYSLSGSTRRLLTRTAAFGSLVCMVWVWFLMVLQVQVGLFDRSFGPWSSYVYTAVSDIACGLFYLGIVAGVIGAWAGNRTDRIVVALAFLGYLPLLPSLVQVLFHFAGWLLQQLP
ncbi:MAG: hypothetical protein WD872_12275 [Pirellulaceae bacterium]